jgi:hypothetical protein
MPVSDRPNVETALRWAKHFEWLGYRPLPSCPDAKKPMCRFGEWWDGGGPDVETLWARFPTTNIQLMTGRRWGLGVIDLDGPEAVEKWATLGPRLPRTWISSSGGGGRHVWFTLPDGLAPLPWRRIWGIWDPLANDGKGAWAKHKAIELHADRRLVMAPPSIHPSTGRVYTFQAGCSPRDIIRPALMPRWVLDLPEMTAPRPEYVPPAAAAPRAPERPLGAGVSWADVLHAIPDKVALAQSWGLRVASKRPNAAGWIPCHDFDREDRNPSARFHPESGRFWRPGERSIGLFTLGAERGGYASWKDCCADLAEKFLPKRTHDATRPR